MKLLATMMLLLAAAPALANLAPAGNPPAPAAAPSAATDALRPVDLLIMRADDYLSFHPDQQSRRLGGEALQAGREEEARGHFLRAARHADKLSQAALAELWWEGRGGERDRAVAYAWMDVAAERGTPYLLAKREQYWAQLDAGERSRALVEGAALQREYRDAVAKPRLATHLRRGLSQMTGSRTGAPPRMQVCPSAIATGAGGCAHWVSASDYYAAHHWRPGAYWRMQERILRGLGDARQHVGADSQEVAR
ncbi:TPR repeat protein [Pseudoxanthomonas japonensis]|jgi:TPR repeat protein|uniref:hypothetical protein n=1 Tax=Pseudoxanthomonas japonensis TaxID=69284 RepID=UPI00285EAD19|nr:hypothetical protein [Pseudoxanthomonas japonensis]MDR7070825.1 TPR repeat protein [Pseudoxanthomonas japonensis]